MGEGHCRTGEPALALAWRDATLLGCARASADVAATCLSASLRRLPFCLSVHSPCCLRYSSASSHLAGMWGRARRASQGATQPPLGSESSTDTPFARVPFWLHGQHAGTLAVFASPKGSRRAHAVSQPPVQGAPSGAPQAAPPTRLQPVGGKIPAYDGTGKAGRARPCSTQPRREKLSSTSGLL